MGYQQDLTPAVLLDTHVWVWIVEGQSRRVGRRTARRVEHWARQDALRISPLSVFEVAHLYASGRLLLTKTLEEWTAAALERMGVRLAPLTIEASIDAVTSNAVAMPDPVDRLLIATARRLDATFVTADQRILDHAASRRDLRTHDARR